MRSTNENFDVFNSISMFSTREMKYIWYLLKKSKFSFYFILFRRFTVNQFVDHASCYSVLSDISVKNELCIPLERGSTVLFTGEGFIFQSPPSKLKFAVRFCSIDKQSISFSAIVF